MEQVTIGPIACRLAGRAAAVQLLTRILADRTPSQVVTLNALMVNHAFDDAALARVVSEAAVVVADSIGVTWAADMLAGVSVERVPGIDLIYTLCVMAAAQGRSVFLLGSRDGVARAAAARLCADIPGLAIAGTRDGYFSPEDEQSVITAVRTARPDIVLVGMDVPRQEKWIAEHRIALGASVVMGVGGSFDVLSGALRRAPRWMRATGTEWLYRCAAQPWRVARIKDLPVFVARVLVQKVNAPAYERNR